MIACHSQFLGLPSTISRNRKDVFDGIRERMMKRLTRWKEKLFLIGGKEVLIKAIVQAIPIYNMNLFKIPIGLRKDIEKLVANFW